MKLVMFFIMTYSTVAFSSGYGELIGCKNKAGEDVLKVYGKLTHAIAISLASEDGTDNLATKDLIININGSSIGSDDLFLMFKDAKLNYNSTTKAMDVSASDEEDVFGLYKLKTDITLKSNINNGVRLWNLTIDREDPMGDVKDSIHYAEDVNCHVVNMNE